MSKVETFELVYMNLLDVYFKNLEYHLLQPAKPLFSTFVGVLVKNSVKPGNLNIFWANSFVVFACK